LLLGSLACGLIAAVTFWPVWAGAVTFAGLRAMSYPRFIASTTGVWLSVLPSTDFVARLLRGAAACSTVLLVLVGGARHRSWSDVVRSCALISVGYMLLAAPVYWAWYVLLPVTLLILSGDFALVLVLTLTSRIVAPLDAVRVKGLFTICSSGWSVPCIAAHEDAALVSARQAQSTTQILLK
jgi:hypothetical protein